MTPPGESGPPDIPSGLVRHKEKGYTVSSHNRYDCRSGSLKLHPSFHREHP